MMIPSGSSVGLCFPALSLVRAYAWLADPVQRRVRGAPQPRPGVRPASFSPDRSGSSGTRQDRSSQSAAATNASEAISPARAAGTSSRAALVGSSTSQDSTPAENPEYSAPA